MVEATRDSVWAGLSEEEREDYLTEAREDAMVVELVEELARERAWRYSGYVS